MRAALDLAAGQHGLIRSAQAGEAGLSRRVVQGLLARGQWVRVGRGVYRVAGAPITWRQQLLAAVLVAGPGAVASHTAAAALWGIAGFREGPIEVTRPGRRSKIAILGAVHETKLLPRSQVRTVDGIPVSSPERTLFDLCGLYGIRRVERAESAVRSAIRLGLTTIGRLAVVVSDVAACGRAGSVGLRAVIAKIDDGEPISESELEDLLEAVLLSAGLPKPRRQVTVGGTTAPIGRVDFLLPPRLVIEADSRAFHGEWASREKDLLRDAKLRGAGYDVIRTTWRMLTDHPDVFIAAVQRTLAEAAAA